MKITNPIYSELLTLKIISSKNIKTFYKRTRDKNVKVLQDEKSKVILLSDYLPDDKVYKTVKLNKLPKLSDDERRFQQFKNICSNKKILDFGCGWGSFLKKLKKVKLKCGVEKRLDCVKYLKKNKIKVTDDITKFAEKFDVVTMFHSLEHLPYQTEYLKKIKSKLKKGGKIIIEVPHSGDFLINFKELVNFRKFTLWSSHLILHSKESLYSILKHSGFKKIKISYFQRYGFTNHLGWFIKNKPGGHIYFQKYYSKQLDENYKENLVRLKQTDTLIAIAEV